MARRVPRKRFWILIAAVALAAVAVRLGDPFRDHALDNIVSGLLTLSIGVILAGWFIFRSAYSRRTRGIVMGALIIVTVASAALLRVERVSGELWPTLAWRFSPQPDRQIPLAEPEVIEPVDLRTTTASDFPQFLGPQRNAHLNGPVLVGDWETHPPRPLWRQPIGAGWSAFAMVNGFAVTMEQRGDQELISCYEVDSGRLRWFHATAARYEAVSGGIGPRSTPVIQDGMVYALGAKGHLSCLDGARGTLQWQRNLLEDFAIPAEEEAENPAHGRCNSPLVVGDLVIVPAGGPKEGRRASLAAYDKRTGQRVWEGGQRQVSYSSPVLATLAGVDQVLIVNEDTASAHDPQTGRQLWEHPWEGHSSARPNVSQAVPLPPDRVFLSKGYGQGAALLRLKPRADGTFETETLWRSAKLMRTKFANVVRQGDCFFGLSDGILECIDWVHGRRVWKEGRYGHGQILGVGNTLLALSESGELLLIEASTERPNHVLGRIPALEGMCWANLALAGSRLLLRNAQEAACYQLRTAE